MGRVYNENIVHKKINEDDKDRIISDLTNQIADTTIRISDMENLINDLCTDLVK